MPRRRSRSNNRSRRSRSYFEITIPNPERRRRSITIRIPAPSRCLGSYRKSGIYCGSKRRLPSGYTRKGKRMECLRKGFGAGMCSMYKRSR